MPQPVLVEQKKGNFVRSAVARLWAKHATNERRLDAYCALHPCLLAKVRKALRRSERAGITLTVDGFGDIPHEAALRSVILGKCSARASLAAGQLLAFERAIDAMNARLKSSA